VSWCSAAVKDCSGEVNLEKNVNPKIPWETVVLFSFAVLLSHGCSLDMALNEVSLLLLEFNCRSSVKILYLPFLRILYAGGHHRTMNVEGVTCSWSRHGQSFDSCSTALRPFWALYILPWW
jgi:hypothetical protein